MIDIRNIEIGDWVECNFENATQEDFDGVLLLVVGRHRSDPNQIAVKHMKGSPNYGRWGTSYNSGSFCHAKIDKELVGDLDKEPLFWIYNAKHIVRHLPSENRTADVPKSGSKRSGGGFEFL